MWHPDRNTHTVDLARRKFEEVKIALDILSDETVRRQYDLKQFESVEGGIVPAPASRYSAVHFCVVLVDAEPTYSNRSSEKPPASYPSRLLDPEKGGRCLRRPG